MSKGTVYHFQESGATIINFAGLAVPSLQSQRNSGEKSLQRSSVSRRKSTLHNTCGEAVDKYVNGFAKRNISGEYLLSAHFMISAKPSTS